MEETERYLTTPEAADMLSCKEITLVMWRQQGKGPRFIRKSGRFVRYPYSDIIKWMENENETTGNA